jgi:hypothetical protein
VVERFRSALPVTFGSRSFVVRRQTYAHPGSGVFAAAANPLDRRYSVVVVAGLGGAATRRVAPLLGSRPWPAAEVVVLPNGGTPRSLILPAPELVRELGRATR